MWDDTEECGQPRFMNNDNDSLNYAITINSYIVLYMKFTAS